MSSPIPVLELRDVVRRFGNVNAVDGLSLTVRPGEVFTLLGPSGCGKSTTLRIVAGLEQVDGGEVFLEGKLIAGSAGRFSLPPEKRDLGMVFQSYAIWPHMSVYENVAFPLRLRGTSGTRLRERVENALELVGLAGLGERPSTNLSGGQQQRVALARAVVYEPKLLLLDEPLSNLDAKLREHMRLEIKALQRRLGIAVLFVTHDQSEAMVLSDRIAVMQAGTIEQLGTPAEVYERPATPFVRDFLGRVLTLEVVAVAGQSPLTGEAVGEHGACFELPSAALANGATSGARWVMAWRPEDVRLELPAMPRKNQISATIESVAYLGDRVEYGVRTIGGRPLLIFGTRRARFEVGAQVGLVMESADATIWPATGMNTSPVG